MQFSMVVDDAFIIDAICGSMLDRCDRDLGEPGLVYGLSPKEAIAHVMSDCIAHDELSSWGIASAWSVTPKDAGQSLVEFVGPRYSLRDWLPYGFLAEAHRQWLACTFLEYESERTDVSPSAVGLERAQDPAKLPSVSELAQTEYDIEEADLLPASERPRPWNALFKMGAFSRY